MLPLLKACRAQYLACCNVVPPVGGGLHKVDKMHRRLMQIYIKIKIDTLQKALSALGDLGMPNSSAGLDVKGLRVELHI